MKTCIEPAKRGDSIKPGVKRSGTPGLRWIMNEKPTEWATAVHRAQFSAVALSHASRAQFSYGALSWGSASLHPRAGSPAEQLGWGARLYASTRCAGFARCRLHDCSELSNSLC